ncbi:MAG: hypothetical protein RLY86_1803 [Pseudomonadota bacterium]|jgi:putative addiction module killer protein
MRLLIYTRPNGTTPFTDWFERLRDRQAKARIALRLRQVEAENLGDHKAVGQSVIELRIHVGPGYRIYCGRHGDEVVVLLSAGDKGSQETDIQQAQAFWRDWKDRRVDHG